MAQFNHPRELAPDFVREATRHMRDTGAEIRTVRGPSMSATPGKVEVVGVSEVGDERVIALRLLQARDPGWVMRPFFARYDEEATWLDELSPAFGEASFFFEGNPEKAPATLRHAG
jgi:hypothetical protein